jgi:ankyrin repeat protein
MEFIEACETGNLDVVRLLLNNGHDPTSKNNLAIQRAAIKNHLDIVRLLLDHGCVPPFIDFNWAVYIASTNCNLNILKLLLKYGCDLTYDNYVIQLASRNGILDVVRLLLDYGCNPTEDDDEGIKWALLNGHLIIFKLLIKWYLHNKKIMPTFTNLNKIDNNVMRNISLIIGVQKSKQIHIISLLINKIKKEIIHEIFLIYELRIPEELCNLIEKFT